MTRTDKPSTDRRASASAHGPYLPNGYSAEGPAADGHARDAVTRLADLAANLAAAPPTDTSLQQALELAIDVVPGCEQAGVSLRIKGAGLTTPASVGRLAAACDDLQEELREGPCITSLSEQELVRVDDMRTETDWPRFSAAAARAGVLSLLACQLATPRDRLGALNLYSTKAHAFGPDSERLARAYAVHVGVALSAAEREANLRLALASREAIGQAIGILVERHRLSASQAFDLMVHVSQRSHLRLRDVADELVRTGLLPAD
jgi:transcriptional regulator with GAF, ATPase, and Fis domain